jgi:TPR repeat protein
LLFCPRCGNPITVGFTFCDQCGAKINLESGGDLDERDRRANSSTPQFPGGSTAVASNTATTAATSDSPDAGGGRGKRYALIGAAVALAILIGVMASKSSNPSSSEGTATRVSAQQVQGQNEPKAVIQKKEEEKKEEIQRDQEIEKQAASGDAKAQFALGSIYVRRKDYEQAIAWYQKAAEQGNSDAQVTLGLAYASGEGVSQDYVKAFSLFNEAADQKNIRAYFELGVMYANGLGVSQNYSQAASLYTKASSCMYPRAMFNLALLYLQGKGVQRDYAKASFYLMIVDRYKDYKGDDDLQLGETFRQKVPGLLAAAGSELTEAEKIQTVDQANKWWKEEGANLIDRCSPQQVERSFTVAHAIRFRAGSNDDRRILSKAHGAKELIADDFQIAYEDFRDDGEDEVILVSSSPQFCGSGGCETLVLNSSQYSYDVLLDRLLDTALGVTNEKINGYRALALIDDHGRVLTGDKAGTLLYKKQMVYPLKP